MKTMTMNPNAKPETPVMHTKRVTRWMTFKANRELLKEKVETKLGYDLTYAEYRAWCEDNGYSWRTGTRAVWSVEKRVSLSNSMVNWWKTRATGNGATPITVAEKETAPEKPITVEKVEKAKGEEDINAKIQSLLANMDF